ncbi:hypothetical protein, partial [Acrocarpospora corrugata]|uniref:hypothetical protein n=1 Tax=Acrocarpospora corrugata TaxID=35763 RepID=UPI001C3FBEA3
MVYQQTRRQTGPPTPIDLTNHPVHRTAILGGLINEYQIAGRHHEEPAGQTSNPIIEPHRFIPDAWDLAAQDRVLMPKHQQLRLLGGVAP